MKIYLAAMYSRRDEMAKIADRLKGLGFEITSNWVYGAGEAKKDASIAIMDIRDVDRADVVISFTQPSGSFFTSGGRHVEFGYALGTGKHCIVIGERENVFHYHPRAEAHPTLDAWLEEVSVPA
jgi:nucleoside 2-deoxyribosyltransferase